MKSVKQSRVGQNSLLCSVNRSGVPKHDSMSLCCQHGSDAIVFSGTEGLILIHKGARQ